MKQSLASAREEFERRVENTGLNTWPCRGGYLITGWGNKEKDIAGELNRAGLPFEKNLSGAFIVTSGSFEREALEQINAQKAEASFCP